MARYVMLLVAVSLVSVQASWGGWLDSVVESATKRAVENVVNRTVGESSDAAYDKAKQGAGGDSGNDSQNKDEAKSSVSEGKSESSGSSTADEKAYSKYDFIPGGKVIFFDDFSDTDVGEFPRKWTLKGPDGGGNAVEVVEYQGKRFLRSAPTPNQMQATQYIRLNQKGDLPEKFTVEFDAVLSYPNESVPHYANAYILKFGKDGNQVGEIFISGRECKSENTRSEISMADNRVHHVAVSVNGTFVKAYVDNQRVINDPDGIRRPVNLVGIGMESNNRNSSDKLMFTSFRLAEGGKDTKSALATDGKIVTHGILFDTGKDVIKPESLPTLKMILGVLNGDPGLKFSIEGHTDNQGGKSVNQPLSEKRAAAVKAWLVDNGIDAGRLTTKGYGDEKPLSSNETAEGRANNRRVEFVRM